MEPSRRAFLKKLGMSTAGLSIAAIGCAKETQVTGGEILQPAGSGCPSLPSRVYSSEEKDGKLIIQTNNIPNHVVGKFPNPNCPGPILAVNKRYSVDLNPAVTSQATALNGWIFAVAVSGVVFDPTGPFWSKEAGNTWEFEVMSVTARPYLGLDGNSAHTQPSGEYHYHGLPYALISQLEKQNAGSRMILIGIAADGFPVYAQLTHDLAADLGSPLRAALPSYRLKAGQRPSGAPKGFYDGTFVEDYEYVPGLGDLDECNGRFGATPEFPDGIYHYYITEAFPFVPRFWRGAPDRSFWHPSPGPSAVPPAMRNFGK